MGADHEYKASIDFPGVEETTPCKCGTCSWTGFADQLDEIRDCSLTPGNPSPAGRCPMPDCGALAYVVQPRHELTVAVTLSSRHVRQGTMEYITSNLDSLGTEGKLVGAVYVYGAFVHIPEKDEQERGAHPSDLCDVFDWCRKHGYKWVRLDSDADVVDDLTAYGG